MNMNAKVNVEPLLERVRRPAHYAGGEWNARDKPWDGVDVKLCMIFPDSYEIGMSNLGIQILYELVNELPRFLCDRAFCPWPDMAGALRATNTPLFGLDSRRPLSEFDMLGFSLPYEMGATGVLEVLDLARVPLESADRGDRDPIVVGGGASLVNPEPMADFFELIVVKGESRLESVAPTILLASDGSQLSDGISTARIKRAIARIGPPTHSPVTQDSPDRCTRSQSSLVVCTL